MVLMTTHKHQELQEPARSNPFIYACGSGNKHDLPENHFVLSIFILQHEAIMIGHKFKNLDRPLPENQSCLCMYDLNNFKSIQECLWKTKTLGSFYDEGGWVTIPTDEVVMSRTNSYMSKIVTGKILPGGMFVTESICHATYIGPVFLRCYTS